MLYKNSILPVKGHFPSGGARAHPPKYFLSELFWYMRYSHDIADIFASERDKFREFRHRVSANISLNLGARYESLVHARRQNAVNHIWYSCTTLDIRRGRLSFRHVCYGFIDVG